MQRDPRGVHKDHRTVCSHVQATEKGLEKNKVADTLIRLAASRVVRK